MSLTELLGSELVCQGGDKVATATALEGKKAIALYFSAHWCPPCRGFTPELAKWYTNDLKANGLEVVFCSSDQDEDAFKKYFGEMPWLALPFEDRAKKEQLSKKFKVKGIPNVVILGPDGALITKNGRSVVSEDPTGKNMPWIPPKFSDIFANATLKGSDGGYGAGKEMKGSDLLGKSVFGLYFSAHWCPPCRGFTPKLAKWYNDDLKAKGFEVVFVSSDRDQAAFDEYFGEQPWLALDFSDRELKKQLSDIFEVEGIPSFVIIDKDGSVITKDGRAAVSGDPKGTKFPWYPEPMSNLKDGPGRINEVTTVIALCESSDEATQNAIEEAMTPIAKKFLGEAKAKGDDEPEISFMIATKSAGLAPQIRDMLKLPELPPAKHEHPLEKCDRATGWGCDGCGCSGAGKERYRCEACDFDFCGDCNAKAGEPAVVLAPKLVIVDVPDDGAYYHGPEGDISTEVVQKLVDDYQAKTLERKQLGQ